MSRLIAHVGVLSSSGMKACLYQTTIHASLCQAGRSKRGRGRRCKLARRHLLLRNSLARRLLSSEYSLLVILVYSCGFASSHSSCTFSYREESPQELYTRMFSAEPLPISPGEWQTQQTWQGWKCSLKAQCFQNLQPVTAAAAFSRDSSSL